MPSLQPLGTPLFAHLPSSDIDQKTLGAAIFLEGAGRTDPTIKAIRRSINLRRATHLPALLVAALSAVVIMDLSSSGQDPLAVWPLQAWAAVMTGWLSAVVYVATFKTPKHKAFNRCAVVPVSVMAPELPALLPEGSEAASLIRAALLDGTVMIDANSTYAVAQRRLDRLARHLRERGTHARYSA